jgi:hypothetical protein
MKSISSAAYARDQHVVIVASTINAKVDEDLNNPWFAGLSAWILDEEDFRPMASDEELSEVTKPPLFQFKKKFNFFWIFFGFFFGFFFWIFFSKVSKKLNEKRNCPDFRP